MIETEIEDEFKVFEPTDDCTMFEALQIGPAKKRGRTPRCPYCHQPLGVGQMVTQRKVWLATRPKGQNLVLTFFHVLCWISLGGQHLSDEDYLKRWQFSKQRKVSFMTIPKRYTGF